MSSYSKLATSLDCQVRYPSARPCSTLSKGQPFIQLFSINKCKLVCGFVKMRLLLYCSRPDGNGLLSAPPNFTEFLGRILSSETVYYCKLFSGLVLSRINLEQNLAANDSLPIPYFCLDDDDDDDKSLADWVEYCCFFFFFSYFLDHPPMRKLIMNLQVNKTPKLLKIYSESALVKTLNHSSMGESIRPSPIRMAVETSCTLTVPTK